MFWRTPILAILPRGHMAEQFPDIQETDDFLCRCHPLSDLKKRVERLMDVVTLHERERLLQDVANRDYLTGLLNRRGLQIAMESLRREDLPLAVCMFDLDNLKKINDYDGHAEGDRYIQMFANHLKGKTRTRDVLCRYGGDEFLVILKNVNSEETAMKKGMEICSAFSSACSGGIAMCVANERDCEAMISCADRALLWAKQENKGGCCLWSQIGEYMK